RAAETRRRGQDPRPGPLAPPPAQHELLKGGASEERQTSEMTAGASPRRVDSAPVGSRRADERTGIAPSRPHARDPRARGLSAVARPRRAAQGRSQTAEALPGGTDGRERGERARELAEERGAATARPGGVSQ